MVERRTDCGKLGSDCGEFLNDFGSVGHATAIFSYETVGCADVKPTDFDEVVDCVDEFAVGLAVLSDASRGFLGVDLRDLLLPITQQRFVDREFAGDFSN